MQPLQGKIVLITGATSGIGLACAEAFAREGAKIIAAARRTELLEKIAINLREKYRVEELTIAMDVSKRASVQDAFAAIPEEWQQIGILINNAGLARGLNKLQEDDPDGWDEVIDTNVKGLLWVTRQVLPGMIERNSGHIINIGSIAGHQSYPGGAVYCASKHAVTAITRSLRMDIMGTAIRVTTVDPGLVETNFSMIRFSGDAERAKKVYAGLSPLSGDDIAETVVFAATRPPHVVIAEMVVFPTAQASATMVHRV